MQMRCAPLKFDRTVLIEIAVVRPLFFGRSVWNMTLKISVWRCNNLSASMKSSTMTDNNVYKYLTGFQRFVSTGYLMVTMTHCMNCYMEVNRIFFV